MKHPFAATQFSFKSALQQRNLNRGNIFSYSDEASASTHFSHCFQYFSILVLYSLHLGLSTVRVTHFAGLFVALDTLTLTHLPFLLLVLIVIGLSRPAHFFRRTVSDWNKLSRDVRSNPNHLLSLFVLSSFLDQSKIISGP